MKKGLLLFSLSAVSLGGFAQVDSHSCQALKQTSSSLVISDVASGDDDYDVNHYSFAIEASNLNTSISGSVASKSTALDNVDTMWFHLADNMNITSCIVNGNTYTNLIRTSGFVQIPLTATINAGAAIDMDIQYDGVVASAGFFSAYSATQNPYGQMVSWTLSEPFGAKAWFPVKEDLTDKIDSVSMDITTPSGTFAGSNGLLQSSTVLPDGRVKNIWKTNYLMDFYLIAFAVADYEEYTYKTLIPGSTDSVLMQNFIYDADYQGQPLVEVAEPYMDEMADMMDIFADKFGMYPFIDEKYGIMMAPMGGGMEHQTMTTQSAVSNVGLTAHELGHQWWGDHVTCSNWNDIWINEGFATYSEYVYFEAAGQTANAMGELNQNHNNALFSPNGTVYVPDGSDEGRIFSGILSYSKGMVVVHMLRYVLGDDFFPFLKHFQTQNAFGNSTTEEFKALLNAYTGEDLSWFIDEWIYGEGYPQYDIEWKQGADGTLWVDIDETPSSVDYFTMYVPLRLTFDDGSTEDIDFRPTEGQANIFSSYSSPKTIVSMELDPDNWILNGASTVTETFPIGLNELSEQVDLIQNPGKILRINNTTEGVLNVKVVNMQGKTMLSDKLQASKETVLNRTSEFDRGIYFVHVIDQNNQSFVQKWVKK